MTTLHFEYNTASLTTIYCVLVTADGQIASANGNGLETYASGNWSDAAIVMTETDSGSGKYFGSIDQYQYGNIPAGRYTAMFFNNASPSIGDHLLGSYALEWSGANTLNETIITAPVLNQGIFSLNGTLLYGNTASSTTVQLVGGVATNNFYNGQTILITAGVGAGQARTIIGYAGSTQVATVSPAWTTTPTQNRSSYSSFVVIAAATGGSQMDLVNAPNSTGIGAFVTAIWAALTSSLTAAGSIGAKLASWVLGSDSKVLLSSNAQTGVTIPTVTAVTNAVALPTGTGTGQINLSGGAVALQSGQIVTAGTVSDKTGYSLSGTQTFNLTGNITGNLSGNVTVGGYAAGQDPATLLIASTSFLNAVAGASTGHGTGLIAINQNTGGTDNLRYVDQSGNGVGDASVLIYLAGDWPANPDRVQAAATTGPDGRWLSPAFVESGTYVAVFTKLGADGPDVSSPFTV